jgi:hypothetical protein
MVKKRDISDISEPTTVTSHSKHAKLVEPGTSMKLSTWKSLPMSVDLLESHPVLENVDMDFDETRLTGSVAAIAEINRINAKNIPPIIINSNEQIQAESDVSKDGEDDDDEDIRSQVSNDIFKDTQSPRFQINMNRTKEKEIYSPEHTKKQVETFEQTQCSDSPKKEIESTTILPPTLQQPLYKQESSSLSEFTPLSTIHSRTISKYPFTTQHSLYGDMLQDVSIFILSSRYFSML